MSTAAKEGTALAKTAGPALPVVADEYAQYASSGFDNQTRDDVAIPFINILQSNSPMVVDNIEGAKAGLLFNSVTNDIYAELDFVPSYTDHMFVEWIPRKEGGKGGFVGTHALDSAPVKASKETQEFGEFTTEAGNDLVETFYAYGVAIDKATGTSFQAAVAFSSTKIKKYKAWMTKARTQVGQKADGSKVPLPLFAHVYTLKTVQEANKHGKFYNFTAPDFASKTAADSRLSPKDDLFLQAVATYEAVKSGMAKVDHSQSQTAPVASDKATPF